MHFLKNDSEKGLQFSPDNLGAPETKRVKKPHLGSGSLKPLPGRILLPSHPRVGCKALLGRGSAVLDTERLRHSMLIYWTHV
jgi:hypothetical protein